MRDFLDTVMAEHGAKATGVQTLEQPYGKSLRASGTGKDDHGNTHFVVEVLIRNDDLYIFSLTSTSEPPDDTAAGRQFFETFQFLP